MSRVKRTEDNIAYARYFANAIGFESKVLEYLDKEENYSIDIVYVTDPIDRDVAILSSIGVSDYPNNFEVKGGEFKNIAIELLMTSYKRFENILDILGELGIFLIKNKLNCQPGTVFTNMIEDFYEIEMKHIMFIEPYLWEDKLSALEFDNKKFHCLLSVPISDKELDYKLKYGRAALEELLFGKEEIDLYNLERKSVL